MFSLMMFILPTEYNELKTGLSDYLRQFAQEGKVCIIAITQIGITLCQLSCSFSVYNYHLFRLFQKETSKISLRVWKLVRSDDSTQGKEYLQHVAISNLTVTNFPSLIKIFNNVSTHLNTCIHCHCSVVLFNNNWTKLMLMATLNITNVHVHTIIIIMIL